MNVLIILDKDIVELTDKQQKALSQVNDSFDLMIVKHDKNISEVLNCEFCMCQELEE